MVCTDTLQFIRYLPTDSYVLLEPKYNDESEEQVRPNDAPFIYNSSTADIPSNNRTCKLHKNNQNSSIKTVSGFYRTIAQFGEIAITCESESDVAYASDRELLTTTLDECETVPLATDVMMPSDVSSSSSVQLSKASGSMTASTTEVVYTISLSFVGVTVILVPLYYIWKRHRRRQRIRRIFRNDNTDPFENLHDHMEVDDSPTAV
ncbi:hypothetical protein ScPMuIL_005676 [Solemya velum]